MPLGDWLKGIKKRLGFFSFRRVLEDFLGKELDVSQLTDLNFLNGASIKLYLCSLCHILFVGVGELSSLEVGSSVSLGAFFEKSPFTFQSGYIDKLRISLKGTAEKGPHISIEEAEFTLVHRGMESNPSP